MAPRDHDPDLVRTIAEILREGIPDNPPGEPRDLHELTARMSRLERERDREDEEMPRIPLPTNENKTNTGQYLQFVGLITLGLALCTVLWNFSARMEQIAQGVQRSEERARVYAPRVDENTKLIDRLDQANKVQDNRIENLADAVRDIRRGQEVMIQGLASTREEVAKMTTRLSMEREGQSPNPNRRDR